MEHNSNNWKSILILGIWSVLFTSYLFYLDEGYFNFEWTRNILNWVFFVIYSGGILGFQYILFNKVFSSTNTISKYSLSILIGTPIGLSFVILLIKGVAWINS